MGIRRNGCVGKVSHKTYEKAMATLRHIGNKGLHAYRCPECHAFHLGNTPDRVQERMDQLLRETPSLRKAKKLTKPQRARLLPGDIRAAVMAMTDEEVLALHDLTHQIMDERAAAAAPVLAKAPA